MASVRHLGDDRWEARAFLGRDPLTRKPRQKSHTVRAKNKKAAQRKANEWEVDLLREEGANTSQSGDTLNHLLDDYTTAKAVEWTPSHKKGTAAIIRAYIRQGLGQVDVAKITTHTLNEYYRLLVERGARCQRRPCLPPLKCGQPGHPVAKCGRVSCRRDWVCPTHNGACAELVPCAESPCPHGGPLAVDTVKGVHAAIRGAFTWAAATEWGGVRKNPAVHATVGKQPKKRKEMPSGADIVRLIAAAEATELWLAAYVVLAIEAGQRRGAMHALRWEWWSGPRPDGLSTVEFWRVISDGVDMEPSSSKDTGGKVTLGPHTTATLQRHWEQRAKLAAEAGVELPGDAYMFSRDVLGESYWHPDTTTHKVGELMAEVGINASLHRLRDVMATWLLSSGVPATVVAKRGGWGELATMLGSYSHALPADDEAAAGLVDRFIAGHQGDAPKG